MSDMLTLWSYWEGKMPPLIKLCTQTVARHNPTYRLTTPEDIRDMGGCDVLGRTERLRPCFRSDLIRLWLLRKFGGVWCDADCIATAPLDFVPLTPDYDLIGVYNPESKTRYGRFMMGGPYGARIGSPLLEIGYRECCWLIDRMQSGQKVPYSKTSAGINNLMMQAGLDKGYRVARYTHEIYSPIQWPDVQPAYNTRGTAGDHEYGGWFNPIAQLYHLGSGIVGHRKKALHDGLLRDDTLISFLINKGLGLPPAVQPRTAACLEHIPRDVPVDGAEVGVFRGHNARGLLQQRPQLLLRLVDSFGVGGDIERYRRTLDHHARLEPHQWTNIRQHAHRAVGLFGGRVLWDEQLSTNAAKATQDGSLDFVFIDAEHSYQACSEDIKAWSPKVKLGGWIGGHDYTTVKNWYGVREAVDKFVAATGRVLTLGRDDTWFVYL